MAQKQKLGRPRAEGQAGDEPVEEEILVAARALFRSRGYSATSTREIANATGLRQPTLFHYYKNKAAILHAIAQRAIQPEIEFLDNEAGANHPPDVGLYRYVRFVVFNLHTNPNVIGSPYRFPELTREDFAEFWQQYDRVRGALHDLINAGVKQRIFVKVDTAIASAQLFGLMEYSLDAGASAAAASKAADTAALLALRSLLVKPGEVDRIVRASGW